MVTRTHLNKSALLQSKGSCVSQQTSVCLLDNEDCTPHDHEPLKVLGTASCRHAMYRHADAMASLLRAFSDFFSCTCLNITFALSCKEWKRTRCVLLILSSFFGFCHAEEWNASFLVSRFFFLFCFVFWGGGRSLQTHSPADYELCHELQNQAHNQWSWTQHVVFSWRAHDNFLQANSPFIPIHHELSRLTFVPNWANELSIRGQCEWAWRYCTSETTFLVVVYHTAQDLPISSSAGSTCRPSVWFPWTRSTTHDLRCSPERYKTDLQRVLWRFSWFGKWQATTYCARYRCVLASALCISERSDVQRRHPTPRGVWVSFLGIGVSVKRVVLWRKNLRMFTNSIPVSSFP